MWRGGLARLRTVVAPWGGRAVLARIVVLASGWWALREGARGGWWFGGAVVVLALAAALALPPPGAALRWRLGGLARLAVMFVAGSLRAGMGVAWRAFSPRLPIAPAVVVYELWLPAGPARELFLGLQSLMPGTVPIDDVAGRIELHALAPGDELVHELDAWTAAVARAAGLESGGGDG